MGTPLFIVTANLLARQRVAVGLVKSVWARRRLSEVAARAAAARLYGRRLAEMAQHTFVLDVGRALVSAKANAETLRALELNAASLSLIATPQAKALARRASVALTSMPATSTPMLAFAARCRITFPSCDTAVSIPG